MTDGALHSTRLGTITRQQLQEVCDEQGLGSLVEAELATSGQWQQNVLLTTSSGRYVLRGDPRPPFQLEKERAVADLIQAHTDVPAPWPYRVTVDTGRFGWAYAVMPRLPGTQGSALWADADAADRVRLAAALGAGLASLHRATFAAPGPFDPAVGGFVPVDEFRSWTIGRIEVLRARCRALGALSTIDDAFLDRLVATCVDALDLPAGRAVLVHHDFSLGNTSYRRQGDTYGVCGVFDLGEAHLGDPEEDLVRFLFRRRPEHRQAFLAAYLGETHLRAGAAERLSLYALADFLFLWEVSRGGANWFGDADFVTAFEPVLAAARSVAAAD